MSQADAPAADWYPDPSGRFQFRYWDGETWTGHVSTDGATDWDPPGESGGSGAEGSASADDGQATLGQTSQPSSPQDEAQPAAAEEGAAPAPSEPADVASEDPSTAQGAKEGEAAAATQPTSGDDQWAPRSEEPAGADTGGVAAAGGGAAGGAVALDKPAEDTQGGTIEEGEPSDTNLVANQRAGLDPDVETWLDEVAGQVEPRLSRIETGWTAQPQAEAARACAYGLLIGHLAHLHPHMRPDLSLVAESHPSFTTLEAGARLDTLEQIARDPQRTAAWLGPLIGTEDVDRVKMLFD